MGEFNRSDASIQVTGLKPGCYYGIRAIATNAAGFSSLGRLSRIRTIPLSGHEGSRQIAAFEQGTVQNHGKRTVSGRRHSPSINGTEYSNGQPQHYPHSGEDTGSEETMAFLTKKLDALRRQQEEIDRANADDVTENERTKAALIKEREELRQKVEEKEKAHLEFKKHVNELEKQCKAAQRKKSAKERLLQQKKTEKQKKVDDIAKWKAECIEMRRDAEAMRREKSDLERSHQGKMTATQKIIEEANTENKVLEEEIRVWGIKIKELEEQKRITDSEQNEEEREAEQRKKDEEDTHEKRIQEYQAQIAALWKANQQASLKWITGYKIIIADIVQVEIDSQQQQDRLNYWLNKRAKEPHLFAPIPGLDFPPGAAHSSRRIRQGASRASTISQSSSGYPNATSTFNSISSMSPSFPSASPFFNMNNGMTVQDTLNHSGMSQRDIDALTGGALMSPTANTLLPSNLLRDDDPAGNFFVANQVDDGLNSPQHPHSYIPANGEATNLDPQSPLSINSRSPSLISSPHESIHNLHSYYPSRDQYADNDRGSINSTGSLFTSGLPPESTTMNGRRLTGLFNFNRQRGKSAINEPPPLGTLKQGQSQSFPRNLEPGPLDPIGSGRRRLGSGTWTNPMSTFLARNIISSSSAAEGDSATRPSLGFARKSKLHMFGSKLEPSDQATSGDRSASPRPSSTYSFENALPRPSSDSQPFGWGALDGPNQRSSPLVADWSSMGGPWSRSQSRRASIQHGSTSNLSLGSTPLDPDNYSSPYGSKITPPAPIGTGRTKASQRSITPKLNPAAPSFTTRLFSRNETKRGAKNSEKAGETSKGKDIERTKDTDLDYLPEDASPPNSRLSRDARSIITTTTESHDSLDHLSASPSESANNPVPKETLMQRITRKSSSSKFNVPWSKDRSSLFSKKGGESSTPGEIDEDASSDQQLGKSMDSAMSTPQYERGGRTSLSWSRVMRKSKKGDKEASESSERTSETETGDDDD